MASGKTSKTNRKNARGSVVAQKSTPWGLIAGVLVVVLFAGAIFGYAALRSNQNDTAQQALAPFVPSDTNRDPSTQIQGVVTATYPAGQHVNPNQQVAYQHSPPYGGAHDGYWATCMGTVYPDAVRQENLVHSMEHGAVWIAYNPDQVSGAALDTLRAKVDGQPYTAMSPYPGLDQPISLQSWGHQLKLSDANDPRVDQFITALRRNQYQYPEVGASCQEMGAGAFTQNAPPAFAPTPSTAAVNGLTVVAEDGGAGTTQATNEMQTPRR
ncbi:DUF3105 domain-containing protein [Pseudonocardia xishanensis]|uniref:DUF3105 domain-containing protein n=1 Tax=Pseudonocardia xishanensis TaxID=630995 RepID=A0ABP8RHV9_9PSEU